MQGCAHWSMASLSSRHRQHRKRCSAELTCHRWIPQVAESFWCKQGRMGPRMRCCSLYSTAHSCGRRPPTLALISGPTTPCCRGSGISDGARSDTGAGGGAVMEVNGYQQCGGEMMHSTYCSSPCTECPHGHPAHWAADSQPHPVLFFSDELIFVLEHHRKKNHKEMWKCYY